jgi:DNA processing protein
MSQPNKTITPELSALRLIRSEGVGPIIFNKLISEFGSAQQAIEAMHTLRQRGKPLIAANESSIEKEYHALEKLGGQWLMRGNAPYPSQLAAIDDAPPIISTLGNTELLSKPILSIVGARNASINGRKLAANIARDLGQAGYVIASGLARGIDAAVHEATLKTGTIAVLANGVDVVYPPENKKLYDAIAQQGLIISENPVGCEPAASLFPRRNRIISGLSQAVIIIEAAEKSGSLITTRFALDQGRDVFAVPGHPADPRASGPNRLIKTGQAQLIESAADVLDMLNALNTVDRVMTQHEAPTFDETVSPQQTLTTDQLKQSVMTCLSHAPCTVDQIIYSTQLPAQKILGILMELELNGAIQRLSGDRVALA